MSDQVLDCIIIGAGPAGLSAAVELRRAQSSSFLVLEKGSSHSQMIRTFYKEGKRVDARYAGQEAICFGILCLKDGNRESFLSMMDMVIQQNQIPIQYNTEVWSVQKSSVGYFEVKISAQQKLLSKTVLVAIGKMGKPRQPDYYKEVSGPLRERLLFDINSKDLDGKKVLVVGGGDSALEYVQMLSVKSSVTLSYRGADFKKANALNVELAQQVFQENKARLWLNSQIQGLSFSSDQRVEVKFLEERASEVFDYILYALGGMNPLEFLKQSGVTFNEEGNPRVAADFETDIPGLFIVGDLLGKGKGGGSIIAGFNSASEATRSLLKKYFNKDLEPEIVSLEYF